MKGQSLSAVCRIFNLRLDMNLARSIKKWTLISDVRDCTILNIDIGQILSQKLENFWSILNLSIDFCIHQNRLKYFQSKSLTYNFHTSDFD